MTERFQMAAMHDMQLIPALDLAEVWPENTLKFFTIGHRFEAAKSPSERLLEVASS